MAAAHITDEQFETQVLQSDVPVLVDFYAEWCGPCKMAAPILDELSTEYEGKAKIVKIDVDQSQLSGAHGVMSIPTVVLFKKGADGNVSEFKRQVGFGGKEKYVELLNSALAK